MRCVASRQASDWRGALAHQLDHQEGAQRLHHGLSESGGRAGADGIVHEEAQHR